MQARTGKIFGVIVASAAVMFAGTTVTAHADDPTTSPAVPIPDPQGPGCEAIKSVASGPGSLAGLVDAVSSTAIASIPEISTFSDALSGKLNPEVNVAAVLDNGPYVVFAPSNDAFAKLPPEQLESLKTDPVALTALVYYHMSLGILGPDDIEGTLFTQQGNPVTVKGSGGDLTFNEAKLVCGGIKSENMRIYIIDTVLDPNQAPARVSPTGTTSATDTTSATETTAPAPESAEATEAAEASEGAAEATPAA